MSDEATAYPEGSPNPTAANPRVRRISTPRPKKVAKKSGAVKSAAMETAKEQESRIPFPPAPIPKEPQGVPEAAGNDWQENEKESSADGLSQTTDSTKRKRRRRKGKGQGNPLPIAGEPTTDENRPVAESETKSSDTAQDQRPRSPQSAQPQPSPRSKIDPEVLTKMAWKIYLAEVSEEGVALIGDNDAKDLSRRCFRLAEIFIEEQLRRR